MHWLWVLWFVYAYPSLKGNGPEDVIAFLLIGGGLVWLGKKLLKEWREHRAHTHALLNHIIVHHPDIPNEVPGLPDHLQPKEE